MSDFTTRGGRGIKVYGDVNALTLDRITLIGDRFDTDPRIASISVVPHHRYRSAFLRAAGPCGCTIAVAEDLVDLVGELPAAPEEVATWATAASERGLWHDWWLTSARDIANNPPFLDPSIIDGEEITDPSSAHFLALRDSREHTTDLSVTIDATWLQEHETGAQVLTVAAVKALSRDPRIGAITLTDVGELPSYAMHLADLPNVTVCGDARDAAPADIMWFPNQIDQRSNISHARERGRRVVATYLDLIAYDISRYHSSYQAWAAYRALQRKIALSLDGITTISADVAQQLLREVPRLEADRVFPLPLGLDHIDITQAPAQVPAELQGLVDKLRDRPFLLVLGNDFQHKNRDFAIAVWQEVLQSGQTCDLVLAGLHVKSSSSKGSEQTQLGSHVDLRGTAHTLGHVSSAARTWLLANASAVIYPSSAEGFGLVPYEAAALGTPSTFTLFGPLAEISRLTDVPRTWNINAYATDIRTLLTDSDEANVRVRALQDAIQHYSWQRFGEGLVDAFVATASRPSVLTSTVGSSAAESAALASVLSSKTWRATEPLRKIGSRLRRG